jgi:hypothetical protein
MSRIVLILILQAPSFLSAQDHLEFIGEKIDFSINDTRFSVNGIFRFVNNSGHDIHQTLLFPFATGTESLIVNRVYNLTYNDNLDFQQNNNRIAFKLIVLSKDTVNLNISYSQSTDKLNVYILESTETWNKPLQEAQYSLTFDHSISIDSLSLKPDTMINNTYYWRRTDFLPVDNFKIWIK